jgi:hypothetical protein
MIDDARDELRELQLRELQLVSELDALIEDMTTAAGVARELAQSLEDTARIARIVRDEGPDADDTAIAQLDDRMRASDERRRRLLQGLNIPYRSRE